MDRMPCPLCDQNNLSWDSRSKVFLCLSIGCRAFFTPAIEGINDEEVAKLLSRGRIKIDPTCFPTHKNIDSTKNRFFLKMQSD